MESFSDSAIILSLRPYLDKGVVVSALTAKHGRHAGFAYKSALSGVEIGAFTEMRWEARVEGQLGTYKEIEIDRAIAPLVIGDRFKLTMMQSICAMIDTLVHEREPHPDLYEATRAILEQLTVIDDRNVMTAVYVMWEILLLRALGYGLDLDKCAASETTKDLIYVSPKTGKAVSAQAGEPYKDRLLRLPPFLRADGKGEALEAADLRDGLMLTQTFFEKWVLTHMTAQLPATRATLTSLLA